MKYPVFELPNGLRLIHKFSESPIAHCGLFVNTGSRDEAPEEHGIAHLIEHLIFKGTKKRRTYYVLSRLEDVGGELNAFTTKEDTCIQASFLNQYYDRTLELLSDIVFHSTFPEKEMEKEKGIVIDELNSYKDDPSDQIFEDFEKMLFNGNPLGRNIVGTAYNVKNFSRKDILHFVKKHYAPQNMVIASVGNIRFSKLKHMVEKYFGDVPKRPFRQKRIPIKNYEPVKKRLIKDTHQAHCLIGNVAYGQFDEKRNALALLNNILGGPCLNSRLTMSVREKHGLAYYVESNYSTYSDTGVFSIYFGTDKEDLDKTIALVMKELAKLRDQKLGTLQLSKAKKQMIGQLAITWDNNENQMLNLGKSFLMFDKVDSMREVIRKVEAITAEQILDVANEILYERNFSRLIYS